jgi:solute carrier family 25 folate transporter 32
MNAVALASTEASLYGTLITQPLWVIKTRMLLNTKPGISDMQNFAFSCRQIVQQHGLIGYARGLGISIILSASGVAQMYFYEAFKKGYDSIGIPQTWASEKIFICGGLSKLLSVCISYPLTTVRTRVQQNQYIKNDHTKKYRGNV